MASELIIVRDRQSGKYGLMFRTNGSVHWSCNSDYDTEEQARSAAADAKVSAYSARVAVQDGYVEDKTPVETLMDNPVMQAVHKSSASAPNFSKMTVAELDKWAADNSVIGYGKKDRKEMKVNLLTEWSRDANAD